MQGQADFALRFDDFFDFFSALIITVITSFGIVSFFSLMQGQADFALRFDDLKKKKSAQITTFMAQCMGFRSEIIRMMS